MITSEYNDNRPPDGQDAREQRRAEQERYDLETMGRCSALFDRFTARKLLPREDATNLRFYLAVLLERLTTLLDQEGF